MIPRLRKRKINLHFFFHSMFRKLTKGNQRSERVKLKIHCFNSYVFLGIQYLCMRAALRPRAFVSLWCEESDLISCQHEVMHHNPECIYMYVSFPCFLRPSCMPFKGFFRQRACIRKKYWTLFSQFHNGGFRLVTNSNCEKCGDFSFSEKCGDFSFSTECQGSFL